MKLYVESIAKKEVKSLVENGGWSINSMISFFVYDYSTGKTIQVFGAGSYGTYGEEGDVVEVMSAKNGKKMFNGEIIDYYSLNTIKGAKTYFLD